MSLASRASWIAAALCAVAAGIRAGAATEASEPRGAGLVAESTPPTEVTECCGPRGCAFVHHTRCDEWVSQSKRELQDDALADDSNMLETTLPRRRIVNDADWKPGQFTGFGDKVAWFFDHPRVPIVAAGALRTIRAFRHPKGAIVTECSMTVSETFKAAPGQARVGDTLSFFVAGGRVGEEGVFFTHFPKCEDGRTALYFFWQTGDGLIAAGSDEFVIPFEESPRAQAVRAFLQHLSGGAP